MASSTDTSIAPEEIGAVRQALAQAEQRLRDARVAHAMSLGPAPAGLEEDVAALRAEELRLRELPRG